MSLPPPPSAQAPPVQPALFLNNVEDQIKKEGMYQVSLKSVFFSELPIKMTENLMKCCFYTKF